MLPRVSATEHHGNGLQVGIRHVRVESAQHLAHCGSSGRFINGRTVLRRIRRHALNVIR